MKNRILLAFITVILLAAAAHSQNEKSANTSSDSAKPFLGRWDLTLKAPGREYPSWLELREENGQLKAQMVGRWGNARPLPSAELSNGHLKFVSPKEEEDSKTDMVFEGTLGGKILSGTTNAPDGKTWQWTGRRAPILTRSGTPRWGEPIRLFDGKDLAGWTFADPTQASIWSVEGGTLVKHGRGSEIVTTSRFRDFKLHVEFDCGPMANSGVYLRGRYEVQVETNAAQEAPNRRMGSVYGFIAPQPELPRTPNVWQSYDITLVGRTVTVVHDGQTVIDRREIPGITGGALDSNEASPGPIYLQGTEDGQVAFRNIVITPAQ